MNFMMVSTFFKTLGVQRSALVLIAVSLIVISFFNGYAYTDHGWLVIPTIVAPTCVPIMFFVLCLDIMMSLIYSSDADDQGKLRYKNIIRIELVSVIVMVWLWIPFFEKLFVV